MKDTHLGKGPMPRQAAIAWATAGLFAVAMVVLAYSYITLKNKSEQQIAGLSQQIADADIALKNTQTDVATLEGVKEDLSGQLASAQDLNKKYEADLRRSDKKIDTLEKLTETDPELLKKYSKVYFLNENYAPPKVRDVPAEFLYDQKKPVQVLSQIYTNLKNLLEDAKDDGVEIRVASGYRSFGTQAALKSSYNVIYGAGTANQFSAEQGYSEHQLGTAFDFITPAATGLTTAFEATGAFKWLQENAHKYGFTLSYPKGNTYYQYEPWHWRFVGEDLAGDLHDDKKNFYDLDQREIDEYLVKIFD